jgi:hypothetical protein
VGHFYSATTKNISTAHWYIIAPPFSHMNTSKKEKSYNPLVPIKFTRDKEKVFPQRNLQLMRNREIDALVEMSSQVIMDKYIDLET